MSIRQGKIIIADSVSSTTDYQDLINKPKINGVELEGNKTTEDLNIDVGITSVNGDTGTNGAVTVKTIENANPNDTMLKVWNGTTAEYLALAEKDLNTIYNVTDEVTADTSKISGFNLFDFKWSDHLINNISWTRADNFSWHSAAVYVSAYNKLLKEKERTSTVLETETIDDITISFYRSENNYKICLPDQLTNLTSLYEKTGVAWYYVIDTENKQFKLPRTKWGFTGLRNKAGDYVPESLPNITGESSVHNNPDYTTTGAFGVTDTNKTGGAITSYDSYLNLTFDASRSSSTYKDRAPVQERATEMYLYFYVGNTVTVESEVNLDTLVTDVENLKKGSGGSLEIGDIGFSAFGIDETKNLRRYLNGQVISQIQFTAFTTRIKEVVTLYPNLATTEANWQAEVTNSKLGQCGKFVIDNTAGTIRLPKVVNINGLQNLANLGGIKAESLPNITGTRSLDTVQGSVSGAYSKSSAVSVYGTGAGSLGYFNVDFDASRSSSTYQDNAPVQQEAVQYPYFIQVATGSEETVNTENELNLNNPFFFGMYQWFQIEPTNLSWLKSQDTYYSGTTYVGFYEWLLQKRNENIKPVYKWTNGSDYVCTLTTTPQVNERVYSYYPLIDFGYITAKTDTTITVHNDYEENDVTWTRDSGFDENKFVLDSQNVIVLTSDEITNPIWPSNYNHNSAYDYVINTTNTTFRLPLKVYGASGNAVVGNGKTLGLTDGTKTGGIWASSVGVDLAPEAYDTSVGTNEAATAFNTRKTLGVTLDPTKSGIETSSQGLYLYFYVGETVQGANLINMESTLLDIADLKKNTLKTNQITNCITEIPQDIKLELNDGVLTLKAGSKVYNGDGTFYTNSSDISRTPSWGQLSGLFVFPTINGSTISGFDAINPNLVFSGNTAPTFSGNYAYWFDTTIKKVKYTADAGVTWSENVRAFPLCLVTTSNNVVTSIDQVFNGFGYIGSHLFVTPGVKGLTPYGRNEDGTLYNTTLVNTKVNIVPSTDLSIASSPLDCKFFTIGDSFFAGYSYYYEQVEQPENIQYTLWYNPNENKMYQGDGTSYVETSLYKQGEYRTDSTGKITYFKVCYPFVAVDKNDSSWVAQQAMPSSKYIDLTLGASGSTYTAPANGMFILNANISDKLQMVIQTEKGSNLFSDYRTLSNLQTVEMFVPARKGQRLMVNYGILGNVGRFRFIYAEGEK